MVTQMAVLCAACGEELLGAVNRCWRCGQAFKAHSGPSDLPPVRRSRPKKQAVVASVEQKEDSETAESEPLTAILVPTRRGSPFADRGLVARHDMIATGTSEVLHSKAQRQVAATSAAILTFPIGFVALVLAFYFPLGGIVVASFGIAVGTWGLHSRRRTVALSGLLLCCLCLALSGFNAAVELYVYFYGVKPWDAPDPSVLTGNTQKTHFSRTAHLLYVRMSIYIA